MDKHLARVDHLIRELAKHGVEEFRFEDRATTDTTAFTTPGRPFATADEFAAWYEALDPRHLLGGGRYDRDWLYTTGHNYARFQSRAHIVKVDQLWYNLEGDQLYQHLRHRNESIWIGDRFISQQVFDRDALITRVVGRNMTACVKLHYGYTVAGPSLVLGDGTVRDLGTHMYYNTGLVLQAHHPADLDHLGRPVYRHYTFIITAHTTRLPNKKHRTLPHQNAFARDELTRVNTGSYEMVGAAMEMLQARGWKFNKETNGHWSHVRHHTKFELEDVNFPNVASNSATAQVVTTTEEYTALVGTFKESIRDCIIHAIERDQPWYLVKTSSYGNIGARRMIEVERLYATTEGGGTVDLDGNTLLSQADVTGVYVDIIASTYLTPVTAPNRESQYCLATARLTIPMPIACWADYNRQPKAWFDPTTAMEYSNQDLLNVARSELSRFLTHETDRATLLYHKEDYVPDHPNQVHGGNAIRNTVLGRAAI